MYTTVICHIFNESYMLPWWLEHHRKIFDHGIIIDYASTDDSCAIIRRICPSWDIVQSQNAQFMAHAIDAEVMDIESKLHGIKMVLNVTEFIFSNVKLRDLFDGPNQALRIEALSAHSDPTRTDSPKSLKQLFKGIERVHLSQRIGHRYIHTYKNGMYTVGRHGTSMAAVDTDKLYLIWFGFYPWNEMFQARKLQIKEKIPDSDKQAGMGFQHLYTLEKMQAIRNESWHESVNLKKHSPELWHIVRDECMSTFKKRDQPVFNM